MSISKLRIVVVFCLSVGCSSGAKELAKAKQAEASEIDRRATAVASELTQKAAQDEATRRRDEAQRVATARSQLRDSVMARPASFFDVRDLQMANGRYRHLTSLLLTNNSKFLAKEIHGTVDLHGDRPGTTDIVASIPIELTGSIASGASMVFSEQQHTLAGALIQVKTAPTNVSFTVTGVVAALDDDNHAAPLDAGL